MVKRKKRLEKGIKSLERQITIHKTKRKMAEEQDKEELVGYYAKEIEKFEKEKEKRRNALEKS